jgi:hypothetical protein
MKLLPLAVGAVVLLVPVISCGQGYPSKPIRIVVRSPRRETSTSRRELSLPGLRKSWASP